MKRLDVHKRRAGITIWEVCFLFVVLAVLGLLVRCVFPISDDRVNAKRQDATTRVKATVNAIGNYRQDYGYYPPVGKPRNVAEKFVLVGSPQSGAAQNSAALFNALRANPVGANAGHVLNPKKVVYFMGPKAKDSDEPRDGFADGPEFAPELQGRMFDPWGGEYCFVMETDADETLDLSSIFADLAGEENFVRYPAVAFSLGKDGKVGGKGYEGQYKKAELREPPDDVVSW